jgi:hypothetical protein
MVGHVSVILHVAQNLSAADNYVQFAMNSALFAFVVLGADCVSTAMYVQERIGYVFWL